MFIHGTTADHHSWDLMAPYLENRLQMCAVDRRGRGASGDTMPYAIEREFEDLATVIDAVADAAGGGVGVFGHSYGAVCALGAATLSDNVARLIAYEPFLNPDELAAPPGMVERLEELLDAGDREGVVTTFYRLGLGMDDEALSAYTGLPSWPARVAAAHTVPRELRAEDAGVLDLQRLDGLTSPVLMLVGGLSRAFVHDDARAVAERVAHSEVRLLDGHEHVAHYEDPALVADAIADWMLAENP